MKVAVKRTASGLLVADTTTTGFTAGESIDLDLEAEETDGASATAVSGKTVALSRFYGGMERRGRPEKA